MLARMRCRKRACRGRPLSVLLLWLLLPVVRAHAAELGFSAPTGCLDARALQDEIEQLIGSPLAEVKAVDFAVDIERVIGDQWQVRVRILPRDATSGDGRARERRIEGGSCDEVASAAAVAVAMAALEREREDRVPEPAPAAASAPGEPASQRSPDRRSERRTSGAAGPPAHATGTRPLRFGVAAGGALDVGALPQPAVGAQLELFAGYGALRVTALGTLFGSQDTHLPDGERGGEFQLGLGALLACAEVQFERVFALACAGFELGQITAAGIDVMDPRERRVGWRALRAEAGLGWPVGQGFSLLARAGAVVPLTRPPFVLDETERVHRPSSLSARVWVGVEFTR